MRIRRWDWGDVLDVALVATAVLAAIATAVLLLFWTVDTVTGRTVEIGITVVDRDTDIILMPTGNAVIPITGHYLFAAEYPDRLKVDRETYNATRIGELIDLTCRIGGRSGAVLRCVQKE